MHRITVYRNKDCAKCRRFARAHQFFDWLHRVKATTDTPRSGPLAVGEIVVEDAATGEMLRGVHAVRAIWRQIPAYMVLLPLLRIPAVARWVDRDVRGCAGPSCAAPASTEKQSAHHA